MGLLTSIEVESTPYYRPFASISVFEEGRKIRRGISALEIILLGAKRLGGSEGAVDRASTIRRLKINPLIARYKFGEKLKGSLRKGSFDKHVRIDLPVPLPVPTPPPPPRPQPLSLFPRFRLEKHPPPPPTTPLNPTPNLSPRGTNRKSHPFAKTTPGKNYCSVSVIERSKFVTYNPLWENSSLQTMHRYLLATALLPLFYSPLFLVKDKPAFALELIWLW